MILSGAVIVGLCATLIRARLTGQRLKPLDIRIGWLVFLAIIPQLLSFQIPSTGKLIPESYVPFILVTSQAMLLVFAAANLGQPGFWALGLGCLANFTVIFLNGGWMPISEVTLRQMLPDLPSEASISGQRMLLSKDWIMPPESIHLPWLSDALILPGSTIAFSIGDVFIAIGTVLLLWSLSDPPETFQRRGRSYQDLIEDHTLKH